MTTRRELEDERTFLLRSLEDLDREHEVGDLSDEDHVLLRDAYVARTAAVLRTLSGEAPAETGLTDDAVVTPTRPGVTGRRTASASGSRGRRRRILVAVAVGAVIAGVVGLVATEVSIRLPGESVTGSVTLSGPQQTARTLAQAETLESEGHVVDAVKLYESVLRRNPNEQDALAEVGWLEYQAGAEDRNGSLLALGQKEEQQAERVGPGAFAPHLYLGSMLLAQGDATGAVTQYRQFLADRPPRATVTSAVSFITEAFSEAHQTPPALPVGGSSTVG